MISDCRCYPDFIFKGIYMENDCVYNVNRENWFKLRKKCHKWNEPQCVKTCQVKHLSFEI